MGMDEKNDAERQALRNAIAAFEPFNEQEAADKHVILRALDTDPNCFDRSAQAHMACSIWVVDPSFTQTLLVYHNIYDSWSWIGGHADGECDLAAVALRELQEENLRLVDENAGYADQVDALNAQLSKLNSRVSTLQDSNAALQQKSAFFDAHVAFVENDGTDYYHNYSCSYFKKQSYWAYSVNLAIARGYTACPYCGG